jgi:NADPH:quinone reductase-like Zn-dependent oxidoreductase
MKAFSVAAALATAVQAVALIMLHLLPTGYHPVRDAVSDYGVGPYRNWFWLQAAAGGVGCLALGIALAQLHPFTPTQVVVALIVTAGTRFLIPFFATDQKGSRFRRCTGPFT